MINYLLVTLKKLKYFGSKRFCYFEVLHRLFHKTDPFYHLFFVLFTFSLDFCGQYYVINWKCFVVICHLCATYYKNFLISIPPQTGDGISATIIYLILEDLITLFAVWALCMKMYGVDIETKSKLSMWKLWPLRCVI